MGYIWDTFIMTGCIGVYVTETMTNDIHADDDSTEAFNFGNLSEGDTVQVTVEARDGDLKDDETWEESIEYVGQQDLKAQARIESHEFKDNDGRSVYLRFSADHKNNFGFNMSQRDKSTVQFDAMRQDPICDDREWVAVRLFSKVEQ